MRPQKFLFGESSPLGDRNLGAQKFLGPPFFLGSGKSYDYQTSPVHRGPRDPQNIPI